LCLPIGVARAFLLIFSNLSANAQHSISLI
jgi:hypothetical protein